jgi:hypothetical protein
MGRKKRWLTIGIHPNMAWNLDQEEAPTISRVGKEK